MNELNYEEMGNKIALKLMAVKRVREPTLFQVQKGSENELMNLESTPAWLLNSPLHPGLPEHYYTKIEIENHQKPSTDVEMLLPNLPFQVNREIISKFVVFPAVNSKKRKLPRLTSLINGSIIITGAPLPEEIKNNVEIFLSIHGKLLPCCYSLRSEVIITSPFTPSSRVRCYYIPELSQSREIKFFSSVGACIRSEAYQFKCFNGSTPYSDLYEKP